MARFTGMDNGRPQRHRVSCEPGQRLHRWTAIRVVITFFILTHLLVSRTQRYAAIRMPYVAKLRR